MRQLLAACLLICCGLAAWAQTPPSTPPTSAAAPVPAPSAELLLHSRPVFTFRAALLGVSARDRAARAHARIQDQLALPGAHAVTLLPEAMGVQVQIDGATSFVITPGDLDPEREDGLQSVAAQTAAALTRAIGESREGRDVAQLSRALAQAVAATAAWAALVWLATRARRALAGRLLRLSDQQAARLRVGGMALFHRERVAQAVRIALTLVFRLLVLVLTVEWLSYVLRCFPYTRAWGETLDNTLLAWTLPIASAALSAVPELLTALLIFYLTWLVTQGLKRFFANVQEGRLKLHWMDPDVVVPTQRITSVAVWLFGLAMAYPYLPGSDTEAFKGLSVLVGLMLSMGGSSLVGQAASGLILTYGRAFRKGEFVRVAEHEGTVTEMGVFTTRIRTGLGEELTLSNASILASTTSNYSRAVKGPGFVLDTVVTIGYDTPWRQVHALLCEAATRTPGVLHDPAPQVYQTALSDWYPVYRLVCQAIPHEPQPRAQVLSSLHAHIQDVFNEYGVQIMSPQYISDPQLPKVVPPQSWYAAPAHKPVEKPVVKD